MRRQTVVLVLMLVFVAGVAEAGMNPFRRRDSARKGYFPENGDVPGLDRINKVRAYKGEAFQEFYGAAGNRYIEYGMVNMMTSDYNYGGDNRRVTIEVATMETPTAAAGLFHHHRGEVLSGAGEAVEAGTEGVVDKNRESRNLYFYRSNIFVKVIYSGKEPVPDLLPIAKWIDGELPTGRADARPDGFAYIEVEGVNAETISLTPGFTFNISFLPASVWASAPGAGSIASDLFLITRLNDRDAAQLYKDYTSYLKLYANYIEEYKRDKQPYTKAVDPNQGRVVFTAYRHVLIIMARPDGYDKGEVIIDRVMRKIDEVTPDKRARGGRK